MSPDISENMNLMRDAFYSLEDNDKPLIRIKSENIFDELYDSINNNVGILD